MNRNESVGISRKCVSLLIFNSVLQCLTIVKNGNQSVGISGEVCVSVELPICIIVPQLRFLPECLKFPNYHNFAKL